MYTIFSGRVEKVHGACEASKSDKENEEEREKPRLSLTQKESKQEDD